jgi:hypothetical protein
MSDYFVRENTNRYSIITPSENYVVFPEILDSLVVKYKDDIYLFCDIVRRSQSTFEMLAIVRDSGYPAKTKMSLLKLIRRCVSPVLDTEMTKKGGVTTNELIETFGHTFKPIEVLKNQFSNIENWQLQILAALLGEYDTRGKIGYDLTEMFFDWFENNFSNALSIIGPRGAGPDEELRSHIPDFPYSYPCDFVIKRMDNMEVCAVGFARYDSTRGGAQADDRTGGNSDKVGKAVSYFNTTGRDFKIIFLSDGPGLAHKDIWEEACELDGQWEGRVRVTTLKTAEQRITLDWLLS